MVVRRNAARVIICDACLSLITAPCNDPQADQFKHTTKDGRHGHVCSQKCAKAFELQERHDSAEDRQATA